MERYGPIYPKESLSTPRTNEVSHFSVIPATVLERSDQISNQRIEDIGGWEMSMFVRAELELSLVDVAAARG